MLRRWMAAIATLALAAGGCGGDPEEGAACESGNECDEGLYCYIETGTVGTCKLPPDACGDTPKCECFDAIRESCPGGSSACVGLGGRYTISCGK